MDLTAALKSRAQALGFCAIGITSADPFEEAEAAAAHRTAEGLMDGLAWWSEARGHASANPRRATPDARAVIALAFPSPSPTDEFSSNLAKSPSPLAGGQISEPRRGKASVSSDGPRGRIAAYALGRDYHEVLVEQMQPLLAMLRERGHVAKTYVDHGWLVARA